MIRLKKRFDALKNRVIIFGGIYSGWETSLYLVKKSVAGLGFVAKRLIWEMSV
ncbi:MAG: hypothetical protein ACYS1A_17055 [Planctomycetota bacterium]